MAAGSAFYAVFASLFQKYYVFRILTVLWIVCAAIPQGTAWAAVSVSPSPGMIRVENRLSGTPDAVAVTGLSPGDIVKVYADGGTASPLGSATVGSGSSGVTVFINQLGAGQGHVYVTVTQPSYSESRRIVKSYSAEPLSVAPPASLIRVTNHAGNISDQVIVRGLQRGDSVKIYGDKQKNRLLGSAAAASGNTDETVVSVGQLGLEEGIIYITVTEPGQGESRTVEKAYPGEPQTNKPLLGDIRIINGLGAANDRVEVSGLNAGDVVKVYFSEQSSIPEAQAITAAGADRADVVLPQLGVSEGIVYISVTQPPLQESARVSKRFNQEPVTAAHAPGMISVTNETGNSEDRVEVYGLSHGDVVKVYPDATSTQVLGTTAAAANSARATVTVSQLGKQGGTVYITVTSSSGRESRRVAKAFAAELASPAPDRSDIQIHNAAGVNDTVTVAGLMPGDIVKLYTGETSTVPASSSIVAEGETSAVLDMALPCSGYGILYVTVTRAGEEESARALKIYAAEPVTFPVSPHQVRVTNFADAAEGDTVNVVGLTTGDRVRLFSDEQAHTPMQTMEGTDAEAMVGDGESTVTINRLRLDPKGGAVYISLSAVGKRESQRIVKTYEAE